MLNHLESKISYLDRVKAQSEVLVPVLNCLRDELGQERANVLVYGALREWSRKVFEDISSKIEGSGLDKWSQMSEELLPLIVDDLVEEPIREDSRVLEFNITGCKFAQFFKEIGEPELGAILTCEVDHHMAAISQQEVNLTIEKTIMKGEEYCDFRYKFKTADDNDA